MNGYSGPVLLDMSAWARVLLDRLPPAELTRFEQAVRAGQVLTSDPFLLEALFSARDGRDYARLEERLAALPHATAGPQTLRLAREGQAALARAPGPSHRVKPIDLLVSAIAHDHAAGVLHYDADYDVIAEHSGLRMHSVWIAGRGTID